MNTEQTIVYSSFIPKAVGLIRSMLSFEKSVVRDNQADVGIDAEDEFYTMMDQAFPEGDIQPLHIFLDTLQSLRILNPRELQSTRNMLAGTSGEVEVDRAKPEIWSLVKNMRRHNAK